MTRWCDMSQWELAAAQNSHPFYDCPIKLSSEMFPGKYFQVLELQGAADVFYASGGQIAEGLPVTMVSGPCQTLYEVST